MDVLMLTARTGVCMVVGPSCRSVGSVIRLLISVLCKLELVIRKLLSKRSSTKATKQNKNKTKRRNTETSKQTNKQHEDNPNKATRGGETKTGRETKH